MMLNRFYNNMPVYQEEDKMKCLIMKSATILFLLLGSNLFTQTPDWDNTVITELSNVLSQKGISKRGLVIAPDNTIHVAYHQNGANNWELFYTYRDAEDNWSEPEPIPAVTSYAIGISLIYCPYQNDIVMFATLADHLHQIARDDTGNWVTELIPTGDSNIVHIDAAIDFQGNMHIIGISTNVAYEPKLIYVTNFNGIWEHDILMDSDLGLYGTGADPTIAVNDDGIVVTAYRGGYYAGAEFYNIHLAQNEVAGEFDWNYEVIYSPNPIELSQDVIIVDDTIHLAHAGRDGWMLPWSTYYSSRSLYDNNWTAPVIISGGYSLLEPTMVMDSEGILHVVMIETSGNFLTGTIFYSSNSSGDWAVSNPFVPGVWADPTLLLDHAGNFQLLKLSFVSTDTIVSHVVHRGAPFEQLLPVPQNLQAETDGFNVLLSWEEPDIPDAQSDLTLMGYNLRRQDFGSGPYEIINDELITDTQFQEINLYPGSYSYYVTAIFADEGESAGSNIVNILLMDYLPAPEFDPPGGEYESFVYVEISSPNEIGTIHYTLDGEEPSEESPVYSIPLLFFETVTLKAKAFHPEWYPSETTTAEYIIALSAEEDDTSVSPVTKLYAPRPNPFNPDTVIAYSIGETTPVTMIIYNLIGQKIRVLVNETKEPGYYEIYWDGRDERGDILPSGVYLYQLKTTDKLLHNKMLLLK